MITLSSGNVQNPGGLAVPNGSISFQLNVDATVIAAPFGIVLAETVVVFQFDSTGNLQSGAQIYSNKELNPQNQNGLGTYYLVTFYDANGARVNKNPMWWQFTEAANSTVNISTMTPYAVLGGNIIFYPIPAGGGGTVTSVAFVGDGVILSATPSTPVTTSGNIFASLLTQSANLFLAGPTTGAAATPTFRAIVAADIAGLITPASPVNGIQFNLGGAFGASSAFTFNNATDQFVLTQGNTLTPVGLSVVQGAGLGTNYDSRPALSEFIITNELAWNMVFANASAPGNTGSTRQDFIAIEQPSVGGGSINWYHAGVGYFFIDGTGTSEVDIGASGGTNLAIGVFGLDGITVTEIEYKHDGPINLLVQDGGTGHVDYAFAKTTSTWKNFTAATSLANANSPALVMVGQAWLGGSPSSVTRTYTIQEKDGALQFTSAGTAAPAFAYTFDSNIKISGPIQLGVVGTAGPLTFLGLTSGSATIQVAAIAGTPNSLVLPIVTGGAGNVLSTDGGSPQQLSWVSVFANPMTTLGDIIYENVTPTAARLAGNITATKMYLSQTGTGSVSAAPVWAQIAAADLSNGTTGTGAIVLAVSPALTGSPTAPTQTVGDSSTKIATDAFVATAITNAIAAVNPAVAVQAASAAILPNSPTYLNGVAGIGATITAGVTNTALVVDGYTPSLNDRILVKNESGGGGLGAGKNGIYFVSQIAAIGLAWILTRALDYDQPSDINNTGAIPVINGTVNTTTQWVITSSITAVDGTQALTYALFSANPSTLAPLASPAFTGVPTAPTATPLTNSTQIATTAYVDAASIITAKPTPANSIITEEFVGGSSTDTTIGQNGWRLITIGTAPSVTAVQAAYPNLGICQLNTNAAATAGQGGALALLGEASSSGTLVNNLQGTTGWEIQWIFKLGQTTATRFRAGIDTNSTVIAGQTGLYVRYDTNATFGDTNFIFESSNAAVKTSIDSGIAVDTNWHRVKITSAVAGTAIFTLYDATGAVLATKSLAISITSATGLTLVALLGTDTTAQKAVQVDYASFYYPNIAR